MRKKRESHGVAEMDQKLRLCVFMTLIQGECFAAFHTADGRTAVKLIT